MVDDIEDISVDKDSIRISASQSSGLVSMTRNKRHEAIPESFNVDDHQYEDYEGEVEKENENHGSGGSKFTFTDDNYILPGRQSVYIKTWGCSHNGSDSEYMAGLLGSQGYKVVFDEEEGKKADLVILNSCTVKNPSEQTFINSINECDKNGQRVVLAGCVPQAQPKRFPATDNYSIIGVQQIDHVVSVVEETLKGNSVQLLASSKTDSGQRSGGAPLHLPKIRRNPLVEIVPINTGCLNQCTYCKTKYARGNLGSYPVAEIVERVSGVCRNEGVVKVLLTSEDTGAYGRDINLTLPDLLEPLVKVIPDGCMMRIGMTNPPYIMEHLQEIADILNHPKVFKFLHIPVQAGSDSVLYDMRRDYNNFEFCYVVDFLRDNVPGITIATDIICGFPTETDEDFEETLNLIRKYKFPVLHISQFYPRPGTPAARLPLLPTNVVKGRSRKATSLFESYQTYQSSVGQKHRILITELSKDKTQYIGHNAFYEQIVVPIETTSTGEIADETPLMGKMVDVKIIDCGKHFLMAHIVDADPMDKNGLIIYDDYDIENDNDNENDIINMENLDSDKEKDHLKLPLSSETNLNEDLVFEPLAEDPAVVRLRTPSLRKRTTTREAVVMNKSKPYNSMYHLAAVFLFQIVQVFIILQLSFPTLSLKTVIRFSVLTALITTILISKYLLKQ